MRKLMLVAVCTYQLITCQRGGAVVTELHMWGRDEDGCCLLVRFTDKVFQTFAVMQDTHRYRNRHFEPSEFGAFPVTTGCQDYAEVRSTCEKYARVSLAYSQFYGGYALADVESGGQWVGKEPPPSSLVLRMLGTSMAEVDARTRNCRGSLRQLNRGISLVREGGRVGNVSKHVLHYGLPMYGYIDIGKYTMPDARSKLTEYTEILVGSHDTITVDPNDLSEELRTRMMPRVVAYDLEAIAARGDTYFSESPADFVIASSFHVYHPGAPDDATNHLLLMDPTAPDHIDTIDDTGPVHIEVHTVNFNDEVSFWREFTRIMRELDPDQITAWNGLSYDGKQWVVRMSASESATIVDGDHPAVLKTLAAMETFTRSPPAGMLHMSRYSAIVTNHEGDFTRTSSAFFGKEKMFSQNIPGRRVFDSMLMYKTGMARQSGLGLDVSAKRHGLGKKVEDVKYADITNAWRAIRYWHLLPDELHETEGEVWVADLTPAQRAEVEVAVMHSIPVLNGYTLNRWVQLLTRMRVSDVTRVLLIIPKAEAQDIIERMRVYAYMDSVLIRRILDFMNWTLVAKSYGDLQYLPIDTLASSGQLGRVAHAFYAVGVLNEKRLAWMPPPDEKEDKYGGGRVYDPRFYANTLDNYTSIIDFSSLYPYVIIDRNLCYFTYVPKCLEAITSYQVTAYPSYTPKKRKYRFAKPRDDVQTYQLPFSLMLNEDTNDGVEIKTSIGALKIALTPIFRVSCDIPHLIEHNDPQVVASIYESVAPPELKAAIRDHMSGARADTYRWVLQMFESGAQYGMVVLHEMDGSGMNPSKMWLFEHSNPEGRKLKLIRHVTSIGGRRAYPAYITRHEIQGIIPLTLQGYLDLRKIAKAPMKKMVKRLIAECEGFNADVPGTWPINDLKAYRVYDIIQQTFKISANSIYGALGCKGPLYDQFLASVVTSEGRAMLSTLNRLGRAKGLLDVYGDTDSVMFMATALQIIEYLRTTDMALESTISVNMVHRFFNDLAKALTAEIQALGHVHAVTMDGIARAWMQLAKKKYWYVTPESWETFLSLDPHLPSGDITALRKIVHFKGLTVVKSDQTRWGKDFIAHVGCAMLARASNAEIQEVIAHYKAILPSMSFSEVAKTTRVNLTKSGPGNSAAARANLRGGTYTRGDSVVWTQMIMEDDSTYFATADTDVRENVNDEWVTAMAMTEVRRMVDMYALRASS